MTQQNRRTWKRKETNWLSLPRCPYMSLAFCFLPKPYRTAFPKQDLEEEVAELFYDVIKDFPELTFGVITIPQAAGRFHVTLDSILVFRKVGLGSYCWREVSSSKEWTMHVCVGFVCKCCVCHLSVQWHWTQWLLQNQFRGVSRPF